MGQAYPPRTRDSELAAREEVIYGHVKISRKAYAEDPFWNEPRKFSRWEAWEDLIQMAAYKPYVRVSAKGAVALERGELVVSIRFLAQRWQWGVQAVRGHLQRLDNVGRISTQRETQVGTVYLLVNYDAYQSANTPDDTPTNTPATHQQHTGNTNTEAVKQLSSKGNTEGKESVALVLAAKAQVPVKGNELLAVLAEVECAELKAQNRRDFEAATLFAYWRSKTRHPRSAWTREKCTRLLRFIKMFGFEQCLWAVDGVMGHPNFNHRDGSTHHELTSIFNFEKTERVEMLAEYAQVRNKADRHPILERLAKKGYRGGSDQ